MKHKVTDLMTPLATKAARKPMMWLFLFSDTVFKEKSDIPQGLVPLEVEFHELRVERRTHHIAPCTNKETQRNEYKAGQI